MSKYGDFKNNFLINFFWVFSHYEEIVVGIAIFGHYVVACCNKI